MNYRIFCAITLSLFTTLAHAEVILESEGMTVFGQHELPKVLYVVPWKRKDVAEIDTPQTKTLATDVLTPIDPEIFKRQARYYGLMSRQLRAQ